MWILPLTSEQQPKPIATTPFTEDLGRFSPDGKWIAYVSDESGKREVYVRPFGGLEDPAPGPPIPVSTTGGDRPVWREDGKELFYIRGVGELVAVSVGLGDSIELGPPKELFHIKDPVPGGAYDTRDGKRFIVQTHPELGEAWLNMVVNWPALVN